MYDLKQADYLTKVKRAVTFNRRNSRPAVFHLSVFVCHRQHDVIAMFVCLSYEILTPVSGAEKLGSFVMGLRDVSSVGGRGATLFVMCVLLLMTLFVCGVNTSPCFRHR